ncbi:MAG TPA: hypothetical protein VMU89_18015 [Thermomicrobiaceae bacterium]|nr:hypothetical protein [Thermomicrobiaceae bacterium]
MDRSQRAQASPAILPGKVLLAGAGFIVSSTVWFLFSFAQAVHGTTILTTLDLALGAVHLLLGAAILGRLRLAVPLGAAIAAISIGTGVANALALAATPTLILPLTADGVSLLLLLLSRDEMHQGLPGLRRGES